MARETAAALLRVYRLVPKTCPTHSSKVSNTSAAERIGSRAIQEASCSVLTRI